ncbi:MAG: PAS domain S-box protein [Rhodocyclaceae bacterium]|nr:PAS domain S-box protein [Rhodocyclaceae bacterium]
MIHPLRFTACMRALLLPLSIVAAFVFTGKVGLMFAHGEGYDASGLFPPAGIALACALVYGKRAWPWIFLGSLLLNISTGFSSLSVTILGLAVALGLAGASLLQATIGAWIFRNTIGYPLVLTSGWLVSRFIFSTLAACLVSASLSLGILMAAGRASLETLPFSWLTWYVGDSLGVILALPLTMTLIGEPRILWRSSRLKLWALIGFGLIVLGALTHRVNVWEKEQALAEFRVQSQQIGDLLLYRLTEQEFLVSQLAALMAGTTPISRQEFSRIASNARAHFKASIQAIEWAPRIENSGRTAFELRQQQDFPKFVIQERNATGNPVVAASRSDYLPVSYVEPVSGNEVAVGFDLASNSSRRITIEAARRTAAPVATPPLKLVQERGSQQGLLLVNWVPGGANGPGLTLVVLRLSDFINGVVADSDPHSMVRLVDADAGNAVLHDGFRGTRPGMWTERQFNFGGRHYTLQIAPTTTYLTVHRAWQSWWLLAGGLSLLGMLSISFLLLSAHAVRMEEMVTERTLDLDSARRSAEQASNLLREAVESIAQGFSIYDPDDRLVLCNDAYLDFHGTNRDEMRFGITFEEFSRCTAQSGQYEAAKGRVEEWVAERVEQHRRAGGEVIQQQLANGHWLMILEYRTPSGYIAANHIDITALKMVTEELRQRELYLRAVIDNLPFMFWLKDTDSRFLAVNTHFSDACGLSAPEQMIGRTDLDIWPRALAEQYRADDRKVMEGRSEKSLEEPIETNGRRHWIETFKKPVVADDGKMLGIVGFARDITERKEMEEALAESRERWELAVAGANDGIWDWNPVTGEAYFSPRWKAMLGYADDEISAHFDEWKSRIHPEDAARVMLDLRGHMTGETGNFQCEFRMRCRDGRYKWILSRGRALLDGQGKPVRVTGSSTDTTARHDAEARISDRNEQLNAIFSVSPDGFVSFDRNHRVKYVSPAFLRLTALNEASVVGLGEEEFSKRLRRICLPHASFRGIEHLRHAGDQQVGRELIELSAPCHRVLEIGLRQSDAETVSQILYFRDVTHETEVDRMKSEFLATAAHELRTPMASIFGFSELLLCQEFDEETRRELVETIHRQSGLITAIVNELLDLARIEARRGKDFMFEPLSLGNLVEVAAGLYKVPPGRNPPLIHAPDVSLHIMADSIKTQQAVTNLISNAYKYSPAGGDVSIRFVTRQEGARALAGIEISDQGIGMTPAQVAHVFERFYRADTSGKIPGTGLGMSIVKEIVEIQNGHVDVQSTLGQGTTVTIWLPLGTLTDDISNPEQAS